MTRCALLVGAALLGLAGCATRPAVVVPERVLVPVDASPTVEMPVCVAVPAPAAGAPAAEVVRAAAERLAAQAACIEQLRAVLAPYTPKQPSTAHAPADK